MQCQKCGFVMSELDTECLRCQRMGASAVAAPPEPVATLQYVNTGEKECPRCGKATTLSASVCDKCGYEYQPEGSAPERYQALLSEDTGVGSASSLRRTVSPALSWSIIGACLLAIGGAGWGMFGGSMTGINAESVMDSPIIRSHHHKGLHGLQTVTYSVTGTAAQAVISYRGADGAAVSLPAAVPLPWTETIKAKPGSGLSLSAQPSDGSGTASVSIQVGSVVRKQADTPGTDGLTTVADTL